MLCSDCITNDTPPPFSLLYTTFGYTPEEAAKRDFDIKRDALRVKSGIERNRLAVEWTSSQRTLDTEEEAAKRDHGLQGDALRARFEQEKDRLGAEYQAEKRRAVEARKQLDELFDQLNRSLFEQRLEIRQDELELGCYKEIDLMRYLRSVLLW